MHRRRLLYSLADIKPIILTIYIASLYPVKYTGSPLFISMSRVAHKFKPMFTSLYRGQVFMRLSASPSNVERCQLSAFIFEHLIFSIAETRRQSNNRFSKQQRNLSLIYDAPYTRGQTFLRPLYDTKIILIITILKIKYEVCVCGVRKTLSV